MSMPKQRGVVRQADIAVCRAGRRAFGSAAAKHVWPAIVVAVIAGCRQGNQFVPPPPSTVTVASSQACGRRYDRVRRQYAGHRHR